MLGGRAKHLVAVVGLFAIVSTMVAACGPSLYTFNIIGAGSAVSQAREANAAEHAPYEYFYAQAYVDKAGEEAAEGNYQDAIRFAERANEFGSKARDMARRRMRELGR
jgi:hypothetical protein